MKYSIRTIMALLLVLVMCLSLVACGKTGDSTEDTDQPNDTADQPNDTADQPNDTANQPNDTADQPGETGGDSLIDISIPEGTELGSRIKDFTFTTIDGKEYSLYETLKTKKMVLINLWATWCGPCQQEFPYMTAAYEEYKDQIEVFALSTEAADTNEILADYVANVGMTFPVGRDATGVGNDFYTGYIPTTLVIDRFGVVCFYEYGSMTSQADFEQLFSFYVGDDYTESFILEDGLPGEKPNVDAPDTADLAAALNAEGGSIAFENPTDEYDWPMKIMNKDDRKYVVSTNKGYGKTDCLVSFTVDAQAGQVLALDYMYSTEADYDYMVITVNDAVVKIGSGDRAWTTWAYEFAESGTYSVVLSYKKDEATDGGSDLVCFDEVRLLSAEDGAEVLASLPQYPHGDATTITPADENAREIIINDPTGLMAANFSGAVCYIISGSSMPSFNVTLAQGVDAEAAGIGYFYNGNAFTDTLSDKVNGDMFTVSVPASTSATYSYITLSPSPFEDGQMILYFTSEEALNTFLARNLQNDDGTLAASWKYADGSAPGTTAILEGNDAVPAGSSLYTLIFVDQNGDPVPGVTANVCDDSTCVSMVSDELGMIGFVKPSFAYHIQVIKVPDGYTYDTSIESYLSAEGGVTEIVVTKN